MVVCCLSTYEEINNNKNKNNSIFVVWHVNYIFFKLSNNTKHVKFQLQLCPWWILLKMGYKLNFLLFFEMQLYGQNCLRTKRQGAINGSYAHRILDAHYFQILFLVHGSTQCHHRCYISDLIVESLIFLRNFTSSTVLEFWVKTFVNKKKN